jgi:hypothetical protein
MVLRSNGVVYKTVVRESAKCGRYDSGGMEKVATNE